MMCKPTLWTRHKTKKGGKVRNLTTIRMDCGAVGTREWRSLSRAQPIHREARV